MRLSVSNPRFSKNNLKQLMRGTDGKMVPKGWQIHPFNFFIASTCKIDGTVNLSAVVSRLIGQGGWRFTS
jgi:hypothetical protein